MRKTMLENNHPLYSKAWHETEAKRYTEDATKYRQVGMHALATHKQDLANHHTELARTAK